MNATTSELQNSLQASIGRVSKAQRVASAVLAACHGEYIPAADLFHHSAVRATGVKTANELSITLSDAYKQRLVGRVPHAVPGSTTRFAYGPPGKTAEGVSPTRRKGVIKSPEKKVVGYEKVLRVVEPSEALALLVEHPGSPVELLETGQYLVRLRFPDLKAVLAYAEIEEVRE